MVLDLAVAPYLLQRVVRDAFLGNSHSTPVKLMSMYVQTVGVSRPSDFDEHVAAAKKYGRADELVKPVEEALR